MDKVANTLVVIVLHFLNVSNQSIVYLKLIQCYVSIVYQSSWDKKGNIMFDQSMTQKFSFNTINNINILF